MTNGKKPTLGYKNGKILEKYEKFIEKSMT
jgi:hypothetical protein